MININYSDCSLKQINSDGFSVPFVPDNFGFVVYSNDQHKLSVSKTGEKFCSDYGGLFLSYSFRESDEYLAVEICIENKGEDFNGKLSFGMGVDSYMASYPSWNEKFFPTLLRCEKTHLWGYYMNPGENALAISTENPVVSYDILYNKFFEDGTWHCGHRIEGTELVLFDSIPKASEYSQNLSVLKAGCVYTNTIYLIPVKSKDNIIPTLVRIGKIPLVQAEKYTLEKGDCLNFDVFCNDEYIVEIFTPDAGEIKRDEALNKAGLYKAVVTAGNGKVCNACFYVRMPWDYYLKSAAENAFSKPQKSTTHVEGFYGFFSAFLYYRHSGDKSIGNKALKAFNEIVPYMFDFDKCIPIAEPNRIQNTALLISMLVDIYQSDPDDNKKYLEYASYFGDFLMTRQGEDGAYRNGGTHYTCVIYIAKSMLELAECEQNCDDEKLKNKSIEHFDSAKKSIDELAVHLDNIETEGEMTFEDGMISCSALQLGMFALITDSDERDKYTKAAEYMMKLHSCLEQQLVPDCKINGASLRYWEAQYDVMIRVNMLNSPHGWTAWTSYAHYYLYMLTGEKKYLLSLMNSLGACSQLVDLEGNLRWAYCPQPYVKGLALVPDTEKEVKDGFECVSLPYKAYRGKYEMREFGQEYINMISDWYRQGEVKPCGGYEFCPLGLDDEVLWVDNQGGCCDNDVHEIFKCIEETVFRKAFIYENDDGTFTSYGCKVNADNLNLYISLNGNENIVSYNLKGKYSIFIKNKSYNCKNFGQIRLEEVTNV